jgi:glycosyltransferase involved in cell wall biosynthesis
VYATDLTGTDRSAAPVSVIIPAHNAEPFLEQAIRTVQRQTVKVTETIVIADDCDDRTAHLAKELGATVIEINRRNMAAGLNVGVSVGVSAATQPWIAFLDADDYWAEEKIAQQWKAVQACPAAAMASCDVLTVEDETISSNSEECRAERWTGVEHVLALPDCRLIERVHGQFLTTFFLATPTIMLRRDVFSQVGFFDETLIFGQTLEFFARVLAKNGLVFVEKPLTYHRIHDGSHTRDLAGYWETYISIVKHMAKHSELYPPGTGEAYRTQLKQRFHSAEKLLARGTK